MRFGIKNAFLYLGSKFRDDMNFEARITKKGDLTMYRKMFTGMIALCS
jgi:hypothetical protein